MKTLPTLPRQFFRLATVGVFASAVSCDKAPMQAAEPAKATATVTIQAGGPGKKISPDLLGVFFEDINYAADGGL